MTGRDPRAERRRRELSCDSGTRCAVVDGMDVLILRCGTCGREVSVTDEEIRDLWTLDCWMCTEARTEGLKPAERVPLVSTVVILGHRSH